jgi:type I restriction enzyme M protein
MILHGIDTPTGVTHDNTLARPYKDYGDKDRVHVIATNPPFGGMEEDGIENNFPAQYRTRETADLFMALIIKLLRVNGRAGVVLPDGFLFGEGTKSTIKKDLIETCNLHTIIRLPGGVFNPYTGIKTNILFFTKGQPTKDIWFWEQPKPGENVNYNKTRPMQYEEFAALQDWWGDEDTKFRTRKENEYAWNVSAEHVAARGYNLDEKNPHVAEAEMHDPDELLTAYAESQRQVQGLRDQLKAILSDALGRKV